MGRGKIMEDFVGHGKELEFTLKISFKQVNWSDLHIYKMTLEGEKENFSKVKSSRSIPYPIVSFHIL